jgi:hypothetical protein
MEAFFPINKKMPTFSKKRTFRKFRKLCIKSTLVCLLAKHEQKEQEPQEQSSSLTNHLISQSNSDENDALVESVLTQSPLPLPYDVEHEEDERDLPFSNDNCDSSLNSYECYQLTLSYHLDETDKDDDLAEVMFGSPVNFLVPFAGNRGESTTPEPTQEYPSHYDDLDLDASEIAILELLVLCDMMISMDPLAFLSLGIQIIWSGVSMSSFMCFGSSPAKILLGTSW